MHPLMLIDLMPDSAQVSRAAAAYYERLARPSHDGTAHRRRRLRQRAPRQP